MFLPSLGPGGTNARWAKHIATELISQCAGNYTRSQQVIINNYMILDRRACTFDGAIEVIMLRGRLAVESTAELTAALQQALRECTRGLILDMSAVEFVSSAGLRVLYMIYKQAVQEGKHLAMFGVQPAVYKILKIVASEATFHVCDSEEDAAKSWPT